MASMSQPHNFSIFLLILVVLLGAASSRQLHNSRPRYVDFRDLYEIWISRHEKVYHHSYEKEERYEIFKYNMKMIDSFNVGGNKPYNLSANKFTDLTHDEFKRKYLGARAPPPGSRNYTIMKYESTNDLPSAIDWTIGNFISDVKSQTTDCGSCWAFASVAAIEAIRRIRYGDGPILSEQQILDCDRRDQYGCAYGFLDGAYNYVIRNGGLTYSNNYPYLASQQPYCDTQKERQVVATIQNFYGVSPGSELALMQAVANQPVSVMIDAEDRKFQFYSGGIYMGEYCTPNTNHAVLVVGYGTDPMTGIDYWLAKNSWGTDWGERGYVRIRRDGGQGICGITSHALFPV